MQRDRFTPVDLFGLVPALMLEFELELAELDRLLEDDQLFEHVKGGPGSAFLRAFHLVLAGIALRGAAFVFRTYRTHIGGAPRIWGRVIAIASTLPGAPDHPWCDRDRGLRVVDGVGQPFAGVSWLQPLPLVLGALTLVLCANLAAVTTRGNFRRRELGIGMVAGVVSVFTLVLLIADAPRL